MKKLTIQELNRLDPDQYREQPKVPVRLLLDNLRSGLNVGSAFRTADAFALEGIDLCGISVRPPHREILKTALGATDTVAWQYFADPVEAVRQRRAEGYRIIIVEQTTASISLDAVPVQAGQPVLLVFGNEVKGVTESLLPEADLAVEIPQYGTKHSLNVSVCLGIVAWEFRKRVTGG